MHDIQPDPCDRPGVWFSLLCDALAKQDFGLAARAKRALQRLGVDVSFRDLPKSSPRPTEESLCR
jgi:hypothetical protein